MIATFFLQLFLTLLVLLVAVPLATGGNVAVRRGGLIRGLLTLLGVAVLNRILWVGFALVTVGSTVLLNWALFGLIGVLVHALALKLFSRLFPDVLRVESYGSACWASVIIMVAGYFIGHVTMV